MKIVFEINKNLMNSTNTDVAVYNAALNFCFDLYIRSFVRINKPQSYVILPFFRSIDYFVYICKLHILTQSVIRHISVINNCFCFSEVILFWMIAQTHLFVYFYYRRNYNILESCKAMDGLAKSFNHSNTCTTMKKENKQNPRWWDWIKTTNMMHASIHCFTIFFFASILDKN